MQAKEQASKEDYVFDEGYRSMNVIVRTTMLRVLLGVLAMIVMSVGILLNIPKEFITYGCCGVIGALFIYSQLPEAKTPELSPRQAPRQVHGPEDYVGHDKHKGHHKGYTHQISEDQTLGGESPSDVDKADAVHGLKVLKPRDRY